MKKWLTWTEMAKVVNMDGECLATMSGWNARTVVRQAISGEFAVIVCDGAKGKIAKLLPTLDAAKRYQFAMHR